MTTDARESLTAWLAVLSFVGLFCLVLWLLPDDLEIPAWAMVAAFGLNIAFLAVNFVRQRQRRRSTARPE